MDSHAKDHFNDTYSYDKLNNMTFDTFPIIGMNPVVAQEVINIQNQTNLMKLLYLEQYGSLPLSNPDSDENIVDIIKRKCVPLIPITPSSPLIKRITSNVPMVKHTFFNKKTINFSSSQFDSNQKESYSVINGKYICNICLKEYRSKENLHLHHLNIHLNIKPYSCGYCKKKFSHRNGKIYHEKNKH